MKKGKKGMKSMMKSHKYWDAFDDDSSWTGKKKNSYYNNWYSFNDDSWRVRKLEGSSEETSEQDRELQDQDYYYDYYQDSYGYEDNSYGDVTDVSYNGYQDTYYGDISDVSYPDTYGSQENIYWANTQYGPEPHDSGYDDYWDLPVCPGEPPEPVYVYYKPKHVSFESSSSYRLDFVYSNQWLFFFLFS